MLSYEIEQFINEYIRELDAGTAAVFAGAGLSVGAGFVNWVTLLKDIAKTLQLDAVKEQDHLVTLAQYYINSNNSRAAIHKALLDNFPAERYPSENHKILARLPISVYWTTNYDKLIEKSLEGAGKIADVKHVRDQLATTKPRRDAVVYKMHGDVDHPSEAVIAKEDYEIYSQKRGPFITALQGDLVSRTFLFVGFSFKDPNLDYVLSRLRLEFGQNGRQHYCIMRKVQQKDFSDPNEYAYEKVKQELSATDLKRYSVKTLFVDDHAQLTEILRRIESAYRQKTLFISGSGHEFGNWSEREIQEFLAALGQVLIDKGYRIVSGFGLGISNALLSGAIERIYSDRKGHFEDFLTVRPFPQHIALDEERKRIWHEYRLDLIQRAGAAIFLFGNKLSKGSVIVANGVIDEYKIAEDLGIGIVPVGATGYAAKEIAEKEITKAKEKDQEHLAALQRLQDPAEKPNELISRILEFLDHLNKAKEDK
jgi:hypothetical protein